MEPNVFATILIEDSYLICGSNIFYVQSHKPLDNGILDMEDLSLPIDFELEDEDIHENSAHDPDSQSETEPAEDDTEVPAVTQDFLQGPIKMRGSNQFLILLKLGQNVNFDS